jgi:hypothetical protein
MRGPLDEKLNGRHNRLHPCMDERISSEHYQDPAEQTQRAVGEESRRHSWTDALPRHRSLVLATTASIIVAIIALAAWWVSTGRSIDSIADAS